ncbi:M16 family metallopeptidase [Hyalangium rubrum]|uniref:Pitrilysin family protein n=1 Tax=Hyalangium rubrum TaxID=3103134 RepID=A0ABU5HDB0_9BACT|nr:pitrilysin family protein [Hyalangium sp. s54d21]MDY7231456.1 pitrilysin family protein [Hyalangium sp. s54d21]
MATRSRATPKTKDKSAASRPLKLPTATETTTSTGLQVMAAERGPLPLVAMRLVLRAGSATDPKDKQGLADFTVRLLRRGTERMSADAIDEAIEFVGASLAAGVSEDLMSLYVTTPAEHFPAMLSVLGQLVREPIFPEKEVELARERSLAQFANDLDDPSTIADRAFTQELWGDHPYGHDVGGTASHVRTFTREDVVRFHRERIGPKGALLVVVGAVKPEVVAAEAEKAFGGWTQPEQLELLTVPPLERLAQAGRILLIDKPDQSQSQVRIGGPGYRIGHPDYFAATAMNIALGGGFTSRLVNAVRVERGLSYSVGSYFDTMSAGGIFAISTFTKTASTREIIDVSLGEVGKVRKGGITPRELKTAQTYLAGLYPLRTETSESVASVLADIRVHGLGDDWVEQFRDRLRAVTPKQVKTVAAKYLYPQAPTMVLLGKASEVKKQLKGLGPVTVVPVSEYE